MKFTIETDKADEAQYLALFAGWLQGDEFSVIGWFRELNYFMDLAGDAGMDAEYVDEMIGIMEKLVGQMRRVREAELAALKEERAAQNGLERLADIDFNEI